MKVEYFVVRFGDGDRDAVVLVVVDSSDESMVVMTEHDSRECYGSLVMFDGICAVGRHVVVLRNYVVLTVAVVSAVVMVVLVVRRRVVVVLLLGSLSLRVLLVLHPPILEPYFDLAFGEVQIARQLPALLLGDVRVEEELFLQLQCLEF